MQKDKENTTWRNEREGNRTAAREYNQAQQRFIKSEQVNRKAREAECDMNEDKIRRELEHAEAVGRRHSHGEDPQLKR